MNKLEIENKLKDNKLPEGWVKAILADPNLFKIIGSGIFPFKGTKLYLSTSSIEGTKIISIEEIITYKKRPSRANMQPHKGLVAFAKMRNTLKVLLVNDELEKNYILSTGFSLIESKILPNYLFQYFLSFFFNHQKNLLAEGTTQEAISNDDFEKMFIIFPSSLHEQEKIAEILETVDETIDKTDAIVKKYKRIKQGLMQDLLTKGITAFEFEKDKLIAAVKKVFDGGDHSFGREENLVSHISRHLNKFFPGWDVDSEVEKNSDRQRPDIIIHKRRTDENLFAVEVKKNENLNTIKRDIEKLENVMLREYHYEDVVFIGFNIENFEDVFKLSEKVNFILVSKNGEIKLKFRVRRFKDSPLGSIPEDWDVVNIKNICKVRQGLQIAIANRFKESGPKRYIYITIQYLNSEEKDKDAEYIQNPPKSVLCGKNDLLMTRTGNTGMVITDVEGVFHNNFFLVDYYKKQVNKIYLFYYLNLPWIQEEVKALAGTTTIPDLNHGDFYSLKFLKPPFPEQHYIAGVLSQIDKTIEKEEKYKEKFERIKQGLMENLLTGKVRVNHLIKEGVESV